MRTCPWSIVVSLKLNQESEAKASDNVRKMVKGDAKTIGGLEEVSSPAIAKIIMWCRL